MKRNRSRCPINFSLEVFGDKWTLLILRDMIFMHKKTYGELKSSPEGIATNILANRLALLEEEKIITKRLDPENSKVYLYELTQKGIDLIPVVLQIAQWGAKYDANSAAPGNLIERIKKDPDGMLKQITAAVKDPSKSIFKK